MTYRRRPRPMIKSDLHGAYMFCLGRASQAARAQNKDKAMFWATNASKLGETLEDWDS